MITLQKRWNWIIVIGCAVYALTQCQQSPPTPSLPLFTLPPSPTLPATPTYAFAPIITPVPLATSVNLIGSPIPLPTPTTVPSPTPIEYTIQTGDTIWTIAARNGFTIDEILTLNPDMRPESIQIGQMLRLPALPTPSLPTRIDQTIPIQVETIRLLTYPTTTDGLWFLGEVKNVGDLPAQHIQVELTLYDGQNTVLAEFSSWVIPNIVPAQETAPFGILLESSPPTFDHAQLTVVGGSTMRDIGDRYLDLEAHNLQHTSDTNWVQLEGEIKNVGEESVHNINLVATLYNENNDIIGYIQHTFPEVVAPDSQIPFTIDTTPPGGVTTRYHIFIQGQVVE